MNIGIIGFGKIGMIRENILTKMNHTTSFYDPINNQLGTFLGHSSIEDLINDNDVIFICTPNIYIYDLIKLCVKNKKHIFCEKPPGISYQEALKIDELQKRNPELKIKFGFNHRYLSHYNDLKNLIGNNEIIWIKGTYGKGYDNKFYDTWRSKKNLAGGGILIDQGIHILDLIINLVGELNIEHAMINQLCWKNCNVEDNIFLHLKSKSGIPISVHSSMVHWKHSFKLEVGTKDSIYIIDGIKSSSRTYGEEKLIIHNEWNNSTKTNISIYNEEDYYTFKKECKEFIDCIVNNNKIECGTTKDAIKIMKLIEGIYDSTSK